MTAENESNNQTNDPFPDRNLFQTITLPIEGSTVWPNIMRLMVLGSIVTGVLFSLALMLVIPPDRLNIEPQKFLVALTAIILFEIILVRRLIIPLNGDYGRYRISKTHVEYYPLSTLGMSVLPRTENIPASDFKGVAIQGVILRDGLSRYYVALVHPQQSNTIRIKIFSSHTEAQAYAEALAKELSLSVLNAGNI